MLAFTFVFFLYRLILKNSQTSNERIPSRKAFLETVSYSVMFRNDEIVVKILEAPSVKE